MMYHVYLVNQSGEPRNTLSATRLRVATDIYDNLAHNVRNNYVHDVAEVCLYRDDEMIRSTLTDPHPSSEP